MTFEEILADTVMTTDEKLDMIGSLPLEYRYICILQNTFADTIPELNVRPHHIETNYNPYGNTRLGLTHIENNIPSLDYIIV